MISNNSANQPNTHDNSSLMNQESIEKLQNQIKNINIPNQTSATYNPHSLIQETTNSSINEYATVQGSNNHQ